MIAAVSVPRRGISAISLDWGTNRYAQKVGLHVKISVSRVQNQSRRLDHVPKYDRLLISSVKERSIGRHLRKRYCE